MLGRKRRDAAEAEARVASISVTLDALRSSAEACRKSTDARLGQHEENWIRWPIWPGDAKSECDRTAQALDGLREHLCTLHSEVAGIREKTDSTGRSMDHLLDDAYISMESHGERLKHISDCLPRRLHSSSGPGGLFESQRSSDRSRGPSRGTPGCVECRNRCLDIERTQGGCR